MPWIGQHCYLEVSTYPSALYEHSILPVTLTGKTLEIDFRYFNRLVQLADQYGMTKEIEIFGLMSNWSDDKNGFGSPVEEGGYDFWRIRCFDTENESFRYLKTIHEIQLFIVQFYDYLMQQNLIDKVRICADEPSDMKLFHQQVDFLQQIAPGLKLKVAINHYEFRLYKTRRVENN